MPSLAEILVFKRSEIASSKEAVPLERLVAAVTSLPTVRPFVASLSLTQFPAIIAEIKKKSPSKGDIRPDLDHRRAALEYSNAGAACLSVLTDQKYFGGSLHYINEIREVVSEIPILRKDFVIDEYQIWESRASGADCILLIAGVLDKDTLTHFLNTSLHLGLDALVEAYSLEEIDIAVHAYRNVSPSLDKSKITLGLNSRDLKTFNTSVDAGIASLKWLRGHYPSDLLEQIPLVAESGIFSGVHIVDLHDAGATAFLVGESLIREGSPGANLTNLITEARSLIKTGAAHL